MRCVCLLLLTITGLVHAQDGEALYKDRCASCHDAPTGRVPALSAIRQMTANAVYAALTTGAMQSQTTGLSTQAVFALLAYIAPAGGSDAKPTFAKNCPADAPSFAPGTDANWRGWSPTVTNTRYQNTSAAGLTAADLPNLKLKWAFNLGPVTSARGQPAIAANRVFFGTLAGDVYALDAATGCVHWSFKATAGIRSGVVVGAAAGVPAIFFADRSAVIYAIHAESGTLLWKARPLNHLLAQSTATPQFHNGVLYLGFSSLEESLVVDPNANCCTFRGSLVAVDAATGRTLWQTFTIAQPAQPRVGGKLGPSGAAIWSTPTIDEQRQAVYVATGDNYSDPVTDSSDAILALDLKTGKLLWSRQFTLGDAYNSACNSRTRNNCPASDGPDFDFGQPPILVELGNGNRALVIGQKSGMVHAIDPDENGAILWQTRVGNGGLLGGSQWGSAADAQHVYVAISDVEILVIDDPTAPGGRRIAPDPQKGGGLHALNLQSGQVVWSAQPATCPAASPNTCSPAQSAAVSAIPGAIFSAALDGHLRAYSTLNGTVLWDFNTAREFPTVNANPAHGGSIDATGPALANGLLLIPSGNDQFGTLPGNVLLAFSIEPN
jgi:polyvinyl alcohol dehydrogenase (cytochrome)